MAPFRVIMVIVTASALAGLPLLLGWSGLPEASAATLDAAAARPRLDNDDNDNDGNELEGQVLSVQCPMVRESDPRLEEACSGLPEGAFIPAINPGSSPPDMYVHNLDGAVRVVFRDPAELAGFSEGDYVRIEGRRVGRFLFLAGEASLEDNDNA